MELLLSSIPPLRLSNNNIYSCFETLLHEADGLRIASGYISGDSIVELKNIFEMNKKRFLGLTIGMHGFEGVTATQFNAIKYLDDYLRDSNTGEVRIATTFKFHGKLYCFLKDKTPFAGIIGSSNLNSIFDSQNNYETDMLLREKPIIKEIDNFIIKLSAKVCVPFNKWEPKIIQGENPLLEGHEGATKVNREEMNNILASKSSIKFEIPIKAEEAPQSNLNAYFGKGRKNSKGFIKPRHWYEVELIVPKEITDNKHYPKAGYPSKESIITVYTDDGWKFECKISGDYSKNFRSAKDLKILGRWIKGRLENSGALKVGELVTREVLVKYGRENFGLLGTKSKDIWILDFKVLNK